MCRWIESFAPAYDALSVIALGVGEHHLPQNVGVYSLGKETHPSPLRYVGKFYRYLWRLRSSYDGVFVHMNQEYVLLAGLYWRLAGKRVVLWYNHRHGTWKTRLAIALAHAVCHTSPQAFSASSAKAVRMPVGIDTDFFQDRAEPRARRILSLGRLSPVKRLEDVLDTAGALADAGLGADIYGDALPQHAGYEQELRQRAARLPAGAMSFKPGVSMEEAADLFNRYEFFINATPSGSFDKTILEALACGALAVCRNQALRAALPQLVVSDESGGGGFAACLRALARAPEESRRTLRAQARAYVEREHSLGLLRVRLRKLFE
jgi:glycosyltransferase involved in cell wall biosynthesis